MEAVDASGLLLRPILTQAAVTVRGMKHHRLRKYRGPETWAQARDAYVAGEPAPSVARRFDVGLSNLRRRAMAEGWTRKAVAARIDLKTARGGPGEVEEEVGFVRLEEALEKAARRAAWLVAQGRGPEARELLRAADELSRIGRYALPEGRSGLRMPT